MQNRTEKAVAYFKDGYNCAQAVALAYADIMGVDEEKIVMIASPFGGGMGRMREVCGAVSGMFMVVGAQQGDKGGQEGKAVRAQSYEIVQKMAEDFKKENGSIICGELLGLKQGSPQPEERTEQYYQKRPCAEYVRCAAEIAGNYLKEEVEK